MCTAQIIADYPQQPVYFSTKHLVTWFSRQTHNIKSRHISNFLNELKKITTSMRMGLVLKREIVQFKIKVNKAIEILRNPEILSLY